MPLFYIVFLPSLKVVLRGIAANVIIIYSIEILNILIVDVAWFFNRLLRAVQQELKDVVHLLGLSSIAFN